jgi:GH18 family chitinase
MKKIVILTLSILTILSACKKSDTQPTPKPTPTPVEPPAPPYVPDNSFKIIAYLPSYRDPAAIDDKKYKMITHLLYAFLGPSGTSGALQPLSNPSNFGVAKAKAKANGVKFGISVGPANGVSESDFLTIAQSETARKAFVKNLVAFVKNNNIDGLDMDWEYPRDTNGGPGAFHLLMKELSEELHKLGKFLSAAVTAGVYKSSNQKGIDSNTFQYVDFFNIMQYDGAGYDSAEPLNHAPYKMSTASLDFWLGADRNMPKVKAIVGIPLYGKNGSTSITYRTIEAAGVDVNVNVATVNGTQWGFNGIALVKQKAQLAKDRANGIMFWEFANDSNNDNSLIKAANDQLGRSY